MTPTREINLNANVTAIIQEIRTSLDEPQKQIQTLNNRLSDLLTGICLNAGLDLSKEGIQLTEDLTKIVVFDLPKEEVKEEPLKKVAKLKKM
jgi:hypothetical protein